MFWNCKIKQTGDARKLKQSEIKTKTRQYASEETWTYSSTLHMVVADSAETLVLYTRLHGITSQKTVILKYVPSLLDGMKNIEFFPPKCWLTFNGLSVISRKKELFITTTERSSNPSKWNIPYFL
jgi:hypothetical protein